jgi:PAP2 superfamily
MLLRASATSSAEPIRAQNSRPRARRRKSGPAVPGLRTAFAANRANRSPVVAHATAAFLSGSHINAFDPTAISGLTTNPSFPSGHTTYAYTDSILLGMMTPALFQSSLSRGAEYANSRIVLGVHYPLDIIASRSLASYDLSQAFTNPDYINNATTTGAAINLPSAFLAAAPELNSYLSADCGGTVASCAASQSNPYAPSTRSSSTPRRTRSQPSTARRSAIGRASISTPPPAISRA